MAHALPDTSPARSRRWSDLQTRAISAGVLVPVSLAGLWIGGAAWIALLAAGVAGMAYEWWQLCRRQAWLTPPMTALTGAAYILPACVALVLLRGDTATGFYNTLFLLIIVWASDIGAYVVGRLVGGPKLAPAISPGKTRSGALGGLVCAMLVGLAAVCLDGGRIWHAMAVAGGLSLVSQAGDLLESWIKRQVGVKDSGWLIPGHGGLFDRLDGLLTAAPAAGILALAGGGAIWR